MPFYYLRSNVEASCHKHFVVVSREQQTTPLYQRWMSPTCHGPVCRVYNTLWSQRDNTRWSEILAENSYFCRASFGVRLSVRPSVTFVYFVKTNKHIFNFFHDQEPHHSSFSLPNVMAVFQPDPNWGVEVRWGRQKSLFSTNRIDDCWSAINSWRLPCSV